MDSSLCTPITIIYSARTHRLNLLILFLILLILLFLLFYFFGLASKPHTPCANISIPPPQNLSLLALSSSSVRLDWNLVSEATSYNVYASTQENFEKDHFNQIDFLIRNVPQPPLTIDNLLPDTKYYFQVSALDASTCSSPASNQVSYTTHYTVPGPFIIHGQTDVSNQTTFLTLRCSIRPENSIWAEKSDAKQYTSSSIWTHTATGQLENQGYPGMCLKAQGLDREVILDKCDQDGTAFVYSMDEHWCLKENSSVCLSQGRPIMLREKADDIRQRFKNEPRPLPPFSTSFYLLIYEISGPPLYLYYHKNGLRATSNANPNMGFIFNTNHQWQPVQDTRVCFRAKAVGQPLEAVLVTEAPLEDSQWVYSGSKMCLMSDTRGVMCVDQRLNTIILSNNSNIRIVLKPV